MEKGIFFSVDKTKRSTFLFWYAHNPLFSPKSFPRVDLKGNREA